MSVYLQPVRLVNADVSPGDAEKARIEGYIVAERRAGFARAMVHRLAGNYGRAHYEIQRSLQRQLRIAGFGTLDVVTACPCAGSRCVGGHR